MTALGGIKASSKEVLVQFLNHIEARTQEDPYLKKSVKKAIGAKPKHINEGHSDVVQHHILAMKKSISGARLGLTAEGESVDLTVPHILEEHFKKWCIKMGYRRTEVLFTEDEYEDYEVLNVRVSGDVEGKVIFSGEVVESFLEKGFGLDSIKRHFVFTGYFKKYSELFETKPLEVFEEILKEDINKLVQASGHYSWLLIKD